MNELNRKNKLLKLFKLQQYIREFFTGENFLDVLTPPAVRNPGMETHLHPFQLKSANTKTDKDFYLHTSPEFHMKELLSEGFEKIFTMSYCFRDEPSSDHHRFRRYMRCWHPEQRWHPPQSRRMRFPRQRLPD